MDCETNGDGTLCLDRIDDVGQRSTARPFRRLAGILIGHWPRASLMMLLLLSGPVGAQQAYCHWLRLTGLTIGETSDFLGWGDYLPLIALEPGELFSLLPGAEASVELAAKRDHRIDGHWYYVPAHLIDDGAVTLRFMLLDRDQDTDDDLVLPMRSHHVRLDQGFSASGSLQIEIPELYVLDDQPTKSNGISFRFEMRRESGHCDGDGAEAMAQDARYRKENLVHHLRGRIFNYFDDPVIAGREVKLFVDEKGKDAGAAFEIARRNLHELLALGHEVERLEGAEGFEALRYELGKLVATLKEKRLSYIRVVRDGDTRTEVSVNVPALASDPEWRKVMADAVIEPIPDHW